jgi:hypothetical protein
LENTVIYDTLCAENIAGYFRYVDDILIIYIHDTTNIEDVLNKFNGLTPGLSFTLEHEQDNQLNFLDLTISRRVYKIEFGIYRKPTTPDVIIPKNSCHPYQHKMAAPRYFLNRMNSYDIDPIEKTKELNTVTQLLQNNGYSASTVLRALNKKKHTEPKKEHEKPKQKWAKFTYFGKETRMITNVFKNSNIRVAFAATNKLGKLLNYKNPRTQRDQFKANGVYQLECPTCKKRYVGQTERSFRIRYKEHNRDYRYGKYKSKYSQHVIEEGHIFGTIDNIMKPLHFAQKGKMLDAWKKFYIFKETKTGNQINDRLTVQHNPIFDAVLRNNPADSHRNIRQ